MSFPAKSTANFIALADTYKRMPHVEFPHLKPVTLAQWALESGWGSSSLADKFLNFAGAKWREYMQAFANPVKYAAHDGVTQYCHFKSMADFVNGYWYRLDREPAYKGWRKHTASGESFIRFVGPIWVGTGPEGEAQYVKDVLRIELQIRDYFKETEHAQNDTHARAGSPADWAHGLRADADLAKAGAVRTLGDQKGRGD